MNELRSSGNNKIQHHEMVWSPREMDDNKMVIMRFESRLNAVCVQEDEL